MSVPSAVAIGMNWISLLASWAWLLKVAWMPSMPVSPMPSSSW